MVLLKKGCLGRGRKLCRYFVGKFNIWKCRCIQMSVWLQLDFNLTQKYKEKRRRRTIEDNFVCQVKRKAWAWGRVWVKWAQERESEKENSKKKLSERQREFIGKRPVAIVYLELQVANGEIGRSMKSSQLSKELSWEIANI